MTQPISIIIVNYYSESLIERILHELPCEEFEYIIVDNSNSFKLSKLGPNCKLINPDTNLGFAAAVNQGVEYASRDFILMMNPDVEISYNTILGLLERARSIPNLGCIAPALIEDKHRGPFVNGGKLPTIWPTFCHYFFLSRLSRYFKCLSGTYALKTKRRGEHLTKVEWTSGALLMMNLSLFRLLEGFTNDWFMYSEDQEICLRIGKLGKSIWIDQNLSGRHIGQASDTRFQSESLGKKTNFGTLWLENLSDFHFRYLVSKSKRKHLGWCFTICFGFLLRALIEAIYNVLRSLLPKNNSKSRFKEFLKLGLFSAKLGAKLIRMD